MESDPHPQVHMTSMVANLEEALSMLMSAGEIAARKGAHTNWPAFYRGVENALKPFGFRPISPRTYRLIPGEMGGQNVTDREPIV